MRRYVPSLRKLQGPPPATGGRWLMSLTTILLIVIAGVIYRYVTAPQTIPPRSTYHQAPLVLQLPQLDWPTYGQSAIATPDDGVLAVHGITTAQPTASTAKLITMLAVMEKKPFALGTQGASLTLHRSDVDLYNSYADIGGSNVPVVVGETISQYQAMQGTLLASSDNLADSLAIWAFGSLAAYREYATQMVLRYGLHDTTIGLDASGLDPSTTSTAHDLALIATRALAQPVIASITRQATAELPIVGTIHNTNVLLGHSEVVGLKTGFTGEAGGVFILGATQSAATYTHTIITVVMGADVSRTAQEAAYTLYQSATRAFQYRTLIAKGEVVGWYEAPWQTRAAAISAQDVGVFVWPTRAPALSVHLEPAWPQSAGEKVGEVRLVQDGSAVRMSPVVLQQAITSPDAWWRIATRPLW